MWPSQTNPFVRDTDNTVTEPTGIEASYKEIDEVCGREAPSECKHSGGVTAVRAG
jgi:hypothetical protein